MAAKRCNVRITANFEGNLEAIETFLAEADAPAAYAALLDDLAGHLIPTLEHVRDLSRANLDTAVRNIVDPVLGGVPERGRPLLLARYAHDITEPGMALGYRFDVVLRGRNETPMETR